METDFQQNAAFHDELAPRYDAHVTNNACNILARQAFVDLATQCVSPGSTLLDFGCGTGIFLAAYELTERYDSRILEGKVVLASRQGHSLKWRSAPSALIRAGHSGHVARMITSHCSSMARKRSWLEYSTVSICCAISSAERLLVPLNSMCSTKCAIPPRSAVS